MDGIPASKIKETEFLKIAHLEENLKKRVLGQDEAVELIAKAIKRTRVTSTSAADLHRLFL